MDIIKKYIFIFLLLLIPLKVFAEYDYIYKIDWVQSKIDVCGYGQLKREDTGNYIDWQYRAVLKAKDNLWENFFKTLKKIRVDAFHYASDILSVNPDINKSLYNYLSNYKKKKLIYLDDGVKIIQNYKFFGNTGFIKYFVITGSDIGNFPRYSDYVFSTNFTGLVIDARGLGKVPAIAPKIYDEDHNLVYGIDYVKSESFEKWGLVQYTDDPYYRKYIDRVGDNPFRTVALKEDKLVSTDIEISNEDARILLQNVLSRNSLEECRVIIILESKSLKLVKR